MRSLADWLALQERSHPSAIDLGLDRVARVARALRLERPSHPVITVAGTNGKGSTVALATAVLRAGGIVVGEFTSPHLLRYNERIRIDGREAADEEIVAAFEDIERARGEATLTFFEYNALAALAIFARRGVDVAVLEVGLGGRLDAVNLVDADVAVITSIGFDHRDWLGETLEAIGREKAGILREGRPAVLGRDLPQSVHDAARALGARALVAGRDFEWQVGDGSWSYRGPALALDGLPPPALEGAVQYANASLALTSIAALAESLPRSRVREALPPRLATALARESVSRALREVRLPGRFQRIDGEVEWILDVAHNAPAAEVLADNLARRRARGRTLAVFGALRDKDAAAIAASLAACIDEWILCTLPGPRGREAQELEAHLPAGARVALAESVGEALALARAGARTGDRIVVFGSFLIVGPALEWLGLY